MGFRCAYDNFAVDVDGVPGDGKAPPKHVQVMHAQRGRFAPSQARVGQEKYQRGVLTRGCCEIGDLVVCEVLVFAGDFSGEFYASGGV